MNTVIDNNSPLISVIIPSYNAGQFIHRCVSSALCQDYPNIEVIVVDDGSTDDSSPIIDSLASANKNVYAVHQSNQGLSGARNTGLGKSSGDYVFFLDADDYIAHDEISLLYRALMREGSDMAVGGFTYTAPSGDTIGYVVANPCTVDESGYWKLAYNDSAGNYVEYVVSWGKLLPRAAFRRNAFDVGRLHEDEFIIHRIVSCCSTITLVNTNGYHYVQNESSIMHSINAKSRIDLTEALLLREEYFAQKRLYSLAWASLSEAKGALSEALLAEKRFEDEAICRRLLNEWRDSFRGLLRYPMSSSRDFLTCTVFFISPRLFGRIRKGHSE